MTEEKTRCRESERRRSGRPLGAAETSKELAEWRSLQWKDLSILGQAKRKGWPQRHKESSWQVPLFRYCRQINKTNVSDCMHVLGPGINAAMQKEN